jgi:hypothetical protein
VKLVNAFFFVVTGSNYADIYILARLVIFSAVASLIFRHKSSPCLSNSIASMQSWLGFRADSGRADLHYYNVNMPTSAGHIVRAGQKGSSRWLLPIIILAAFAIRLVVVCFTYRDLPDADKYYEQFGWEMGWIARALASGHGFSSPYYPLSGPTAIESPLYPGLLAVVFKLFGIYSLTSGFIILSINSLLSALTCIPVYFSAKYSLGARGAWVAAWVWAFYPFAIYFSAGRVWEYALTGLLFATCFCIAQRIHHTKNLFAWLGWGALCGLTALSNSVSTLAGALQGAPFRRPLAGERCAHHGCGNRRPHPVDSAQLPTPRRPLPDPRQHLAGVLCRRLRQCSHGYILAAKRGRTTLPGQQSGGVAQISRHGRNGLSGGKARPVHR